GCDLRREHGDGLRPSRRSLTALASNDVWDDYRHPSWLDRALARSGLLRARNCLYTATDGELVCSLPGVRRPSILGVAFWRARVAPAWSSIVIVLAAPVMGPLAYGFQQNALQIFGYLMVAVASIPVARYLWPGPRPRLLENFDEASSAG